MKERLNRLKEEIEFVKEPRLKEALFQQAEGTRQELSHLRTRGEQAIDYLKKVQIDSSVGQMSCIDAVTRIAALRTELKTLHEFHKVLDESPVGVAQIQIENAMAQLATGIARVEHHISEIASVLYLVQVNSQDVKDMHILYRQSEGGGTVVLIWNIDRWQPPAAMRYVDAFNKYVADMSRSYAPHAHDGDQLYVEGRPSGANTWVFHSRIVPVNGFTWVSNSSSTTS